MNKEKELTNAEKTVIECQNLLKQTLCAQCRESQIITFQSQTVKVYCHQLGMTILDENTHSWEIITDCSIFQELNQNDQEKD